MTTPMEIKGGAGEFEAAVIAVVLDRIAIEEREAQQGRKRTNQLPAWVRAIRQDPHPGSIEVRKPK